MVALNLRLVLQVKPAVRINRPNRPPANRQILFLQRLPGSPGAMGCPALGKYGLDNRDQLAIDLAAGGRFTLGPTRVGAPGNTHL